MSRSAADSGGGRRRNASDRNNDSEQNSRQLQKGNCSRPFLAWFPAFALITMSHARRVYPISMTSCVHPPCPLFCVLWVAKTGLTNRVHSFLFVCGRATLDKQTLRCVPRYWRARCYVSTPFHACTRPALTCTPSPSLSIRNTPRAPCMHARLS